MDVPNTPTVYTDDLLPTAGNMFELYRDYAHLMDRLHGGDADGMQQDDFHLLLKDRNELLVFVISDGQMVATAQATLSKTPPQWHVYINNVVTHDDHEGLGHGRRSIEGLLRFAKIRWGVNGERPLRFELTNSPQKGNAGFYEKLGFTARIPENDNETVVWFQVA